jgi:hypothetical protein
MISTVAPGGMTRRMRWSVRGPDRRLSALVVTAVAARAERGERIAGASAPATTMTTAKT